MRNVLAALLLLAKAIPVVGSYVYKIDNGQCGESSVQKMLVGFALRASPGLKRGRCKDNGYTVFVGTKKVDSGNRFVGKISTSLYTKPTVNRCTAAQIAPLTSACQPFAGSLDPSTGICASACFKVAATVHASGCVIPGEEQIDIEALVEGCDGYVAVKNAHSNLIVGLGDRCSIGYCKSGKCPKCSDKLKCNPDPGCSGACYGTCVQMTQQCSTCAELGWPLGKGARTVCAESDKGFSCTSNVVYAKAEQTCRLAGARLCTAGELLSGEGQGTGCGHDGRFLWTSSITGAGMHCKLGQKLVVKGSASKGSSRPQAQCEPVTSKRIALRCCADTVCSQKQPLPDKNTQPVMNADGVFRSLAAALSSTPEYSTLLAAVSKAGLLPTLETGAGPYTVFAPTNTAFAALDKKTPGTVSRILADKATLKMILTYHIVSGAVHSYQLKPGMKIKTLETENIVVGGNSYVQMLNSNTQVIEADLEAQNGIAHGIDSVLLPPKLNSGH